MITQLSLKDVHLYDLLTGEEVPRNKSLDLKNERIPFDTKVQNLFVIGPTTIVDYSYWTAGIQLSLKRTDRELLYSGYFVPTGMFALFSLMSFLVSVENVGAIHK